MRRNRLGFREQVVRKYQKSRLSVGEAPKRLSLPKATLNNRVIASGQGKLAEVGKHQRPLTETELELSKLKRAVFAWIDMATRRTYILPLS